MEKQEILKTPTKVIIYKTPFDSAAMYLDGDDEFVYWNNTSCPKRARMYFALRKEKTYKEIKRDFPETLDPTLDETESLIKIEAIYKHLM